MRTVYSGIILLITQLHLIESVVFDLTLSGINDFTNKFGIKVIYFETKDSQSKFPIFLQEYKEAALRLKSYGVELAKVNCLVENHVHCTASVSSLFVFRDNKVVKTLPIKNVKDEPTIVANILHRFLLKDELQVAQTEEALEKILEEAKGKRNIVLANVQGIGMKDHRNFLEVAFTFGDSFQFCLTTKLPLDIYGSKSNVKVFLCKERNCEVRHYYDSFKIITMATFLNAINLPKVFVLDEKEEIPYQRNTFLINLIYLFVRHEKNLPQIQKELESIANSTKETVGIIIVQVERHIQFLSQFGLADDSGYPAIGFIPSYKVHEDGMNYVDIFTSHDQIWSDSNTEDFIRKLLNKDSSLFDESAVTKSLVVGSSTEYESLVRNNDEEYLFVSFCVSGVEDCTSSFIYDYQRLSRTVQRHLQRSSASNGAGIHFVIILSNDVMDTSLNINSYPSLRLHRKKQPVSKFTEFKETFNYEEMLEFVKQTTGESYMLALPPSGLDYVDLFQARDGLQEAPISMGDEPSSDSKDSEDSEGDYYDEKPPEEIEDDEVAAAGYELFYTKSLKDENVMKLNDTSFNSTINKYDIAVVFFSLPWEARGQAFTPSYAAAVDELRSLRKNDVDIDGFQVNCFDWEDVCRKENVLLFPSIRIYRKRQHNIDYHGALDQESLVNTLILLQVEFPLTLSSDGEVIGFEVGKYPMPYIQHTDIAVLGLFPFETSKELTIFQNVAKKMEGKYLFASATGEVAADTSFRLGVKNIGIVLFKRKDLIEPKVVFDGIYTEESILDFIKKSSLPLYGELTPLNFPVYHSFKKPLLLVFKDRNDHVTDVFVSNVLKSNSVGHVQFCWLDISSKVNQDILREYSRNEEREFGSKPVFVLVDHIKEATYTYLDDLEEESFIDWIQRCGDERETYTGTLKKSDWKPRLEGYDFLALIKEDQMSGESERLGRTDPWKDNDDDQDDNHDDDDNDDSQEKNMVKEKDQSNQRFHTAFHAKRQSRINERQQAHIHNEL